MKNILSDVEPKHYFWLNDGTAIKNLQELRDAMARMSDDVFRHHASESRNDFHNWVRDIHKDKRLAGLLLNARSREEMAEFIERRMHEIKNPVRMEHKIKKAAASKKKVKAAKRQRLEKIVKKVKRVKRVHKAMHKRVMKPKRIERVKLKEEPEKPAQEIIPPVEVKEENKEEGHKSFSLEGTAIALATLIGFIALINLSDKPGITGASVADMPASYNWVVVVIAIAVIAAIILAPRIKKRHLR